VERIERIKIIKTAMVMHFYGFYSSALQVAKKPFGENSLVTAKIYSYLGTLNSYQDNYNVRFKYFFLF